MRTRYQVCGVVALLIAVVVAFRPHYVLYVPKVGWILHLAIGGNFPPFLDGFDSGIYSRCKTPESCPWLSSGDVIVDACGKCGTNWLMTIVHELRTWNQTDLRTFRDIHDPIPWPEQMLFPGDNVEHRHENWGNEWNNSRFIFKEFKSHFPVYAEMKGRRVNILPVKERPDIRFIFMVRNPADQVVSMSHFMKTLSPEMRNYWGGIPYLEMSLEMCVSVMFGDPTHSPFLFFKTIRDYQEYPNVLLLHYADVFKDPNKYIRKIAEFLKVDGITNEALERIAHDTSIEEMKKRAHQFQGRTGKNRDIPGILVGGIVRKGGLDGKQELPDELKQKVHAMTVESLGPEEAYILENGFDQN